MAIDKLILLTGATGYIGGRLLKELEAQGRRVRCVARRPEFLRARIAAGTEVVAVDVLDSASLNQAMSGVDTAYYLVHSMQRGRDFSDKDRQAAQNFGAAACAAGVRRIIYVGGLGDDRQELSAHLRSRHEVGDVLRASGVPVLEFRASIIIGSGSLSFELIRALVERLPAMIMPRWVNVIAQPIAINDILAYLVAGLDVPLGGSRTFEIGGTDCVSYGDIMREYARQRELKRLMIPVPLLTPKLSSLWLGLVTPLYARVGRILVDSMRHETVVRDGAALEVFPIRPLGIREAIADALRNEDHEFAQTRWSDSLSTANPKRDWGGVRFGNRIVDRRTVTVAAPPEAAFAAIERIGGTTGWYLGNALWQLRGWLDLLAGGVGMRRGRRDARHLLPGDVVDCWRVESIEPPRHLRLTAEMKLPGRAWLEFEVQPDGNGARLRQTATFDPLGLWGLAYWYGVWPLHQLVFAGLLRGLAQAAGETGREMRIREFQSELWLPIPPEELFPFFADAANLDFITPPWLHFHIVTPPPIELRTGTLIDYKLRVRGLPLRWRTRINVWQPPHRLVDEQIRGPYQQWIHEHTFEPRDGGTLARDVVRYAMPLDWLVHRWFVRPDIEKIFQFRTEGLRRRFATLQATPS